MSEERKLLSEIKREQIHKKLSNQIGLIVPGMDCSIIIMSSDNYISMQRTLDNRSCLFILGFAWSVSEKREFELMFNKFENGFYNLFSERDMNILAAHDLISDFLKSYFYTRTWEESKAMEFILVESDYSNISVSTIEFDGSSVFWKMSDGLRIIGCYDEQKIESIKLALIKSDYENLPIDDLKKVILETLKNNGFNNDFITIDFEIKDASTKAKDTSIETK